MKKKFLVLFFMVCGLLLLCACKSNECTILYASDIGGSVVGDVSQTVEMGDNGTQVCALAETGYRFVGWSDGVKTSQRLDTNVTESKTVTAQFEKIEYVKITYMVNEGGYVFGNVNQAVESGSDATQVYAVAETGYRFVGWSDGVKTSQRLDTNITESKTITAQFKKIEYKNITYIASEGGNVYGNVNQAVESGSNATQVYAVAETGYRFVGWSDGVKISQRLDTNVTESKTITAQFKKIEYKNITYIASEGGNVYGNVNQAVESGSNATQVYAVAETGYRFVGWSDGVKISQRLDTNVTESKTITAQFEKIEYVKITYMVSEGGYVFGKSDQTIEKGENCTQVYAVAEAGYRFIGWSDGVKTSQRLDTNVTESKTITAQFEKIEYVDLKFTASEGGSVYGNVNQVVESGSNATQVYAAAEAGYRFLGWSDGVECAQRLDTNITESKTVTAQFEAIMVLFYSDDMLVRRYTLNEFKTIDISKIVGYASSKMFIEWEFLGAYAGYNNGDCLQLISTYFTNMSELQDISLRANYTSLSGDYAVPLRSKTIAHALGGYNNKNYLNSQEAFETNYQKGFRFFEADVALTTDGVIVLDHNRGNYTYEEFTKLASNDYTPLTLEKLFDYMTVYPEIWVDLDTLGFSNNEVDIFISSLKQLVNNYDKELLNRIIVEITPWNESLIDLLKIEIGITNFLYTESWYTNDLVEFERTCQKCNDKGISYVSIANDSRWEITKEKVDMCHKYGLYFMAYTVNSPVIMYKLYDLGVDCIFTDFNFI